MTLETRPLNPAEYIDTPKAQAELLADAFGTGDATYIAHALRTVARAQGMTRVAQGAGISREGLYKALSGKSDPRLSTLLGVAKALGFALTIQPAGATVDG